MLAATTPTTTTTTPTMEKPALFMNKKEEKFEQLSGSVRNSLLAAMAFAEKAKRDEAARTASPLTIGGNDAYFWDHILQKWRTACEIDANKNDAEPAAETEDVVTALAMPTEEEEEHKEEEEDKAEPLIDDLDVESLKSFGRRWRRSKEVLSIAAASLGSSTGSTVSSVTSSRLRTPLSSAEATPAPSAMPSTMPSRAASPSGVRAPPGRTPTTTHTPSRVQSATPSRDASRCASPTLLREPRPPPPVRSQFPAASAHPYSVYADTKSRLATTGSAGRRRHSADDVLTSPSPSAASAARTRAAALAGLRDKQSDFEARLEAERARWRAELDGERPPPPPAAAAAPPLPAAAGTVAGRGSPRARPSLVAASVAAKAALEAIAPSPTESSLPQLSPRGKAAPARPAAQKRLVYDHDGKWSIIEF